MKDYLLKDYEGIGMLEKDFVADLNKEFADLEITSNKYTDCEILEVERSTEFAGKQDVIVSVSCNAGIKGFCFRAAVGNGLLVLPQDKKELFDEYFKRLDSAYADWQKKLAESIEQMRIQAELEMQAKAKRKAELAAKQAELEAKEKLAKRIAKAQEKFATSLKSIVKLESDPIEWLRQNTVSIIATVPTHLEKVFKAQFPDADYHLVDSSRKTSGGNSMKWSESFCLTVKSGIAIHPALEQYFTKNKLHNTSLIATLVRDENFEFSKLA